MIPILPETAWREFRGAAPKQGQNLTVHQALIVDPTGQEHKCFVKAAPHGNPMPFTEAVAWMLADALRLPRPKFAALLMLPVQRLRSHVKLDQHWLHYTHALAFCAATVDGKHISSRWRWLAHVRKSQAFRHEDVSRIAAFDMWVENQDRHAGNFLRTRDGAYVPIDNEFILYTLVWQAANIAVQHHSLRKEAQEVLTAVGSGKFEVAMLLAGKLHAGALEKAAPALRQFIIGMHPDPEVGPVFASNILRFLEQRASAEWLANELGHIT